MDEVLQIAIEKRKQTKNQFADAYVRERIKMTYLYISMNGCRRALGNTERNAHTNFIVTYVKESFRWLKRQI